MIKLAGSADTMPLLRSKVMNWLITLFVIVLITSYYSCKRSLIPYRHPTIEAEQYISPEGCQTRRYVTPDQISSACASAKYVFTNWSQYGLAWPGPPGIDQGRQTGTYYRIGPDLVGMRCNFGRCRVSEVERNVFVVKDRSDRGTR